MEKSRGKTPDARLPYVRVTSLLTESDREGQPNVFERLLSLAEGKVTLGGERRASAEQISLVRESMDEMKAFADTKKDYLGRKIDQQLGRKSNFPRIEIENDYKDPFKKQQVSPMFRIRLVANEIRLTGTSEDVNHEIFPTPGETHGMTVDIEFAIDGANDMYELSARRYHKNDPRQGNKDPRNIVRVGQLSKLTLRVYEIITPIINGYRELAAQDRVVNGGETTIKGHQFKFNPLP